MAVLAIRLLAGGFWRVYPVFTAYIVTLWTESGVLFALTANQRLYGKAWVVSRVLVLVLEMFVVLSIFSRWTISFPGIGTFGRGLFAVLVAISLGLSLSTLPAMWSRGGWAVALRVTAMTSRFSSACFAFFLLLTIAFFSKFGGPVAPNLRRHSWSMAVFATANAISYFVLSTRAFRLTSFLLDAATLLALGYWIFAFRKSGELKPVTVADPSRWAVADAMNGQLLKLADAVTPRGVKKRK
jgi:hypothetical protein